MSAIRCPQCKLVNNNEDDRRCRRCGTPLLLKNEDKALESAPLKVDRSVRHWAVPVIVIVCLLGIYGFYKHLQGAPNPAAEVSDPGKTVIQHASESRDESRGKSPAGGTVRKLHQDFVARLDQNMADRNGEGFKKSQALTSETMTLLNQQQNNPNDPAAQAYLGELSRLVEKFNAQLIQYNSETRHLSDVRQQIDREIDNVQQDSSLTPEQKISRKRDLNRKYFDEAEACSVNSKDLDETMNSLRNLSASAAGK